jgi:ubiquinone/menaquinone biosynthesis C-methylase UbiE
MSSEHHQRHFLPAAGRDFFLPLYDPIVNLIGFDRSRQELISQGNVEPGHHILDLGCGTGTFVVRLKRQYPTAQVIGLDPDPKAILRAETKLRRAGVSVQLDRGFSDQLPYKDESFDRVFSSFMFHHLDDQERAKTLREVFRVLKRGGSFHLLDFVPKDGAHGFIDRFFHSHARLKDNTHGRILELMNRAGFSESKKMKEESKLFNLMRAAYYKASV